jgi:REP element-mobilizing transposase RayT
MSRLCRPFLYDRFIFVTANLLRSRTKLNESKFARLAVSLARMRQKHGFLLTAWVFLPDHWHAIINGRDNSRSQSFAYDALNRIWLARTQATTGANAWGQAFGYDPWGNLLTTALTQGAAPHRVLRRREGVPLDLPD